MVERAQAMSDAEVEDLAKAMGGMTLSIDQRNLCTKVLAGRSLSCSQAGAVLGAVKLGIGQRMFAREVLQGRLRGLPEDVEDALAPISAELRGDIRAALLAPEGSGRSTPSIVRSVTAPVRAKEAIVQHLDDLRAADGPPLPARRSDWPECVERLRARVGQEPLSDELYGDLADAFRALGLGALPPPSARGGSVASSRTLESVVPYPGPSVVPRAPDRAPDPSAVPSAPDRPPDRPPLAAVPPAPIPGCSLPTFQARSLKVSALPEPPVPQAADNPATHLAADFNERNRTVDDAVDNMSEESC